MKFFIAAITVLFSLYASAQNFPLYGTLKIKNYSYSDYNGNAQNWDAIQNEDEVMIFANNGGVLAFDGLTWYKIALENGDHPRSLGKDEKGRVFVGGVNEFGYLDYDELGKIQYIKISQAIDSIYFDDIWSMFFIEEKAYFIARNYIFEYDSNTEKISIYDPPVDGFIQRVVEYDNNLIMNVKFGDEIDSCFLFDGQKLEAINNTLNVNPVILFEQNDQILILDEKAKVHLYNPVKKRCQRYNFFQTPFPENTDISCALKNENTICVGTNGYGIYIFNSAGKFIRNLNEKDGLGNLSIRSLFLGHLNNLWICYDNGIGFLESSTPVSNLQKEEGINVITEDILVKDSMIYLATHSDFFYTNIYQQPLSFKTDGMFQQDLFQCKEITFPDGKSYILIIANNGIYALDEKNQKIQVAEDVYAWDLFQSTSNPNLVHIGLESDGVGQLYYMSGHFEYQGTYNDTHGDVRAIWEEDHAIYFGVKGEGIYKIDLQNKNKVTQVPGLIEYSDPTAQEEHFQICKFQDTLYVGSVNGLYKISDDKLIPCNYGDLILNKSNHYVYRMRNDNEEKLWMVIFNNSGKGNEYSEVGYLAKNSAGSFEWISAPFKEISESVIYDIQKDPEGNYWFAGSDRISIYNPSIDFRFDSIAPPTISRVNLNTDSIYAYNPKHAHITTHIFDYDHNTIRFQFTSSSYFNLFNNEFSWYLEGEESEWTEWEYTNYSEYQRLSEGTYTFHLKSKNYYGVISPETSFTFTISPPWYRTWWAYIIYFLLTVLLIYSIIRLAIRRVKQQNIRLEEIVEERTAEIAEQNAVLEHQKAEIQEKTNDILDSIVYAKRIQNTILPTKDKMKTHFESEHFVLYRPKDIVSGDFYWTGKIDGRTIFAAIDCTGHGVPGAFVSIVGFNGMNRAINEFKKRRPHEILDKLREIVVETFSQSESNVKDGMDIALCSLDYATKKIHFSGANNSLIILRGTEFIEIKANKQPIGEFEKATPFDHNEFQLESGDCVYVFTDGYADQFGGDKGKKLKSKNLKDLLLKYKEKPMAEQEVLLSKAFDEWKGNFEQLDDVCLIGVKIE